MLVCLFFCTLLHRKTRAGSVTRYAHKKNRTLSCTGSLAFADFICALILKDYLVLTFFFIINPGFFNLLDFLTFNTILAQKNTLGVSDTICTQKELNPTLSFIGSLVHANFTFEPFLKRRGNIQFMQFLLSGFHDFSLAFSFQPITEWQTSSQNRRFH